jgi:succinate dehydrogenase / fumarate reductase cytochrome b subunit
MSTSTRPLYASRLGSLVSVLPLGVWTVNHLWRQLSAFAGASAWESSVTQYAHPVSQAVVAALVFTPLLVHSVWGFQRLFSARPNNLRYPTYSNLRYLLQRLSALGLLAFLGAHVWMALLKPRWVEGHAEAFEHLAQSMRHHGPTLAVYLLGTLAVSFHLGNGVSSLLFRFGVAPRRGVAEVSFALLLALSWGATYALWRAGA